MSDKMKYWKGLEELAETPEVIQSRENEFPEELPVDEFLTQQEAKPSSTNRRDFLKFLGFSAAAATLASCEAPVVKSIPYLNKPEEITPGVANWYASAYYDGNDYCDVLVKTREGRPIKIEGNPMSRLTKGGTNARVQASVLSLYDSARLKEPTANGDVYSWDAIDSSIVQKLKGVGAEGGKICILSSSIISPSTEKAIAQFAAKYDKVKHVTYDAVSMSGMTEANKFTFGTSMIPSYRFDKADVIVSFACDFLVNWLSPVEYSKQYIVNRKLDGKKTMSKHIQLESNMTVTGSNADARISMKASELSVAAVNLYNAIARKAGEDTVASSETAYDDRIANIADELWSSRGKALVVGGSNDMNVQVLFNEINKMLGSYGKTIDNETLQYVRKGNDQDLIELVEDMKSGSVGALIIYNCNPVYNVPAKLGFAEALKNVRTRIAFSDRADETTEACNYNCPDHHGLESWNDACPAKGHYAISQPTIRPLFNTRQAQESLLRWAGDDTDFHTYIQNYWEENLFTRQSDDGFFNEFWVNKVQDGVFYPTQEVETAMVPDPEPQVEEDPTGDSAAAGLVAEGDPDPVAAPEEVAFTLALAAQNILERATAKGDFECIIYEKAGIGHGLQANNPWLQEMPDPITKATWDNYLTMSPEQMKDMGLNPYLGQEQMADVVNLRVNGKSVAVPVLAQPGQAKGTVGIAVGYGRTKAGRTADNIGANAFAMVGVGENAFYYEAFSASVSGATGEKYQLAATQTHHTLMDRDSIVKETTLADYINDPKSGNPGKTLSVMEHGHHVDKPVTELTLWENYEEVGHFWNMSIDLNSCIGCGTCVVSCQAENNVPVVGKDEVRRGREMHWMRIDRYYSSDYHDSYSNMEIPSENPKVLYQPLMCQHCNHAPCETVCPVIATSHSTDGLNMMTYNRCVGTRYCANNCPYKVRRFNWFNYANPEYFNHNMADPVERMVLNPDVVVRSRGVMEKCSMCVQRIQGGKLDAKLAARKLKDGEIQTACSQSCPTDAIKFGDVNDPESSIVKAKEDERAYHLLEEVGILPNVFYLTKVRNNTEV